MKTRAAALGLVVFGLAPAALAQERFATAGRFAVGVERVFGYASTNSKVEGDIDAPPFGNVQYESDTTRSQFDFLAKGDVHSPFVSPRIGFDYFVIDGLSVGGAFAYTSDELEGDQTFGNNKSDIDKETSTGFLVAPRVGYCFMFNDTFGIWPRGGFTYFSGKEEVDDPDPNGTDTKFEASGLNLTLEGMFVITPVQHAGFMLGPTLDLPLTSSGEIEIGNSSGDLDEVKITTIALQAGVFVWF